MSEGSSSFKDDIALIMFYNLLYSFYVETKH